MARRPQHVADSLLQAFKQEFSHDLALLRREWEQYTPTARTSGDDLADLRRTLHTIKGSTRLLGFAGLPEQVHELEAMVIQALEGKEKPPRFWDGLADLEEAVARVLGEAAPLHEAPASMLEPSGVPAPARRGAVSSTYEFLIAVDELLVLGQDVAETVTEGGAEATDLAALLVERARALREQARRMALVPASELFAGMTELARRNASDQGKSVRVVHQVAPDQLEREMVLGLRPALLHLVGNAVSHGLSGNSGVITFRFQRRPHDLLVAVADNGRGLSIEALKGAVVQAGHLSEAEWDKLPTAQQLQWIFHPGLSTKPEADVSAGRGMGMAVVAETAERLGGRVEIESSPRGTEFRLVIPTDWNLRAVLRVRSGHRDFAVLRSELAAVEAANLESDPSAERLGELSMLLGYPGSGRRGPYRLLLEKSDSKKRVAIGVDHIGDFEEVLFTPLLGFHGLPSAIVGVTPIQGVALPVVSLARVTDASVPIATFEPLDTASRDAPLLLVVDDSVTTRTLVTGILQAEGYRVIVAADGGQGLELAQTEGLELVISDYQMPILDGLAFLEKLRADSKTSSLPFLLLTSIDDVATFERASALGADRCLGRQNFTQDLLLKSVRELL